MKITNLGTNLYIQKPYTDSSSNPESDDTQVKQNPEKLKKETNEVAIDSTINVPPGSHLVRPKETLYSIANRYKTTVANLIKLNPDLKTDKNGNKIIQVGSIIKITDKPNSEIPTVEVQNKVFGSWTIEQGKGAYSIMTKFNLFREELTKLNPEIDLNNIKQGTIFKVPGYLVKSGDTLEQIAKAHGITVEMLKELNPDLKDTLTTGSILNVPKLAGQKLEDISAKTSEQQQMPEYDKTNQPHKTTHTVKNGEALSKIAEKYNVPMWAIMLKNNIQDDDKIFKNQIIEIPSEDEISGLKKLKNTKAEPQTEKTYTVKSGDTLSEIAMKYEVPTAAIMYKNNIQNPKHIKPGQKLLIPDEKESEKLSKAQKPLKNTPRPNTSAENTISSGRGIVVHKVRKNDTLNDISKKYNIPVKDLIIYNENLKRIKSTDRLTDKEIKTIRIIASKKAVIDATGVSEEFINDLISIEKKHNRLYNDDCGIPTIGIGHNTKAHGDTSFYQGKILSDNQIYSLLARDIFDAKNKIRTAIGKDAYDNLSQVQKEALYGLVFNTGNLQSSPKLCEALRNNDYAEAARQMDHACGTINGKKQVLPGLAKRRFMDISKFIEGSKLSKQDIQNIMTSVQHLYDSGFKNIQMENTKVDYNAYAKKFLGEFIDKGWIKLKS